MLVFFFNLIDTLSQLGDNQIISQNATNQNASNQNATNQTDDDDYLGDSRNDETMVETNLSLVINQLTNELALKVNDKQLVHILQEDKGKFRNLHKLKSESSAHKWIQQNRFIIRRLNLLVANITEEFVVHELLANNGKVDQKSADLLIERISQHLAANQNKILPADKRLRKIEVSSGFLEGITALTLGKTWLIILIVFVVF